MPRPEFSIVTPSYNMLSDLKLCILSIKDQNILNQHIIVDSFSSDGTQDYLKTQTTSEYIIEKDSGMYEALNKGLLRANGNIIGHLNCDEQYLPGILKQIKADFDNNPRVDIIYGNYLTINHDNTLNSFKKSIHFNKNYILSGNLYIATCGLFYRRKIFDDGNFFNTGFKVSGDKEFLLRLYKNGYQFLHLNKYLSCFKIRNNNLSQNKEYIHESDVIIQKYLKWPRKSLHIFSMIKKLNKFLKGAYTTKFPITYAIYTSDAEAKRKTFISNKVGYITSWNNI